MGLASFYQKINSNFGSITAAITDCLKKGWFQWTEAAEDAFKKFKILLQSEPLLVLPDFEKLFEIECDTCVVGIRAVLRQEGHPIACTRFICSS